MQKCRVSDQGSAGRAILVYLRANDVGVWKRCLRKIVSQIMEDWMDLDVIRCYLLRIYLESRKRVKYKVSGIPWNL